MSLTMLLRDLILTKAPATLHRYAQQSFYRFKCTFFKYHICTKRIKQQSRSFSVLVIV